MAAEQITEPSTVTGVRMYRMMVECRLFEERVHRLFLEGIVKGTTHLAMGQEAVAAGLRRGAGAARPRRTARTAGTTTRCSAARRWPR